MDGRHCKVILHGAFQNENFGDVLLLKIFKAAILERRAGVEVYGSNVGEFARKAASVKKAGVFIKLDRRVPLVFCGGGYLGERAQRKYRWGLNLWFRHLYLGMLSMLIGRRYVVLSTGFGPLSLAWYREPTMWFMRRAKAIRLRDKESIGFYRNYGGVGGELVADAVLSVDGDQLKSIGCSTTKIFFKEKMGDSIRLGVHIPGDSENKSARAKISDGIKKAVTELEAEGKKVSVVIFSDNGIGKEYDYFSWFDRENCQVASYHGVDDVLAILKSADCIITTKLHVGICSAVFGKRILSFAAHQKTKRFYSQIGRPELCDELAEVGDDTYNKIKEMLSGTVRPVLVSEEVRELASKSWRTFDKLFDGKD